MGGLVADSRKQTQNKIGEKAWQGSTDEMSFHFRPRSRARRR